MDDGRDRQPSRLETVAQSLTIAIAAISACLAFYREYQTMKRESSELDMETLHVNLKNLESQLAEAQRTNFDSGMRDKLAKQLVDIRRRVRAHIGKAETASSVDSNLRKAQTALESCGGPFSAPYPDAGIALSHRPPDDFIAGYPSSSRYPQYPDRNAYPPHAERRYDLPQEGGCYPPIDNFREPQYIPNRGGAPPPGYHYGSGGYSHGDQYGTRTYRTGRNNTHF